MEGVDNAQVSSDSDKEGEAPGCKLEANTNTDGSTSPSSPRKSNSSKTSTTPPTKTQVTPPDKDNNKTCTYQTIITNDFLSIKPSELDLSDSLGLSGDEEAEEDIFEKARRKYSVVDLDSEDGDL